MSSNGYAQFLLELGHTVRQDAGLWWFNAHPHIYMPFPFDTLVNPKSIDKAAILGRDGWAARFPTTPELGRPSYRIACDNQNYDLSSLRSKTRNQTRRGLENCECRRIGWEELIAHGVKLNIDTLVRQGRTVDSDIQTYWKTYFSAAAQAEGAEAWGAFHEGELAAYLIAFIMNEKSHVLIVRSNSEKLKFYPNNAMLFSYLYNALTERGLTEVSIGLESIQTGMDGLDKFKEGMGFRKIPMGQRIILKSMLKLLTYGPLPPLLTKVIRRTTNDEKAAKFSGLVSWYKTQPKLL